MCCLGNQGTLVMEDIQGMRRAHLLGQAGFPGCEGGLDALLALAQPAQALCLSLRQLSLCSAHLLLPRLQLLVHLLDTQHIGAVRKIFQP